MSTGRRKFTTEDRIEAAHRVIDSRRSIAEVARVKWVRDEQDRVEATRGTELEPSSWAERFELQSLRKKVVELEKNNPFLGKASAYFAANPAKRSDSR